MRAACVRPLVALIDGLLLDEVTRGPVSGEERRRRLEAAGRIIAAGGQTSVTEKVETGQ